MSFQVHIRLVSDSSRVRLPLLSRSGCVGVWSGVSTLWGVLGRYRRHSDGSCQPDLPTPHSRDPVLAAYVVSLSPSRQQRRGVVLFRTLFFLPLGGGDGCRD